MYKTKSRILLLFITFLLVTSIQAGAQDDFSNGEILNVPDFEEQPVNTVENINASGQNSLTTIFASDNGRSSVDAGIFFDIENVGSATFSIERWDINVTCNDAPSVDITVYRRVGTFQGFENAMDGWTLVGTETVTCAVENSPTPLMVSEDL